MGGINRNRPTRYFDTRIKPTAVRTISMYEARARDKSPLFMFPRRQCPVIVVRVVARFCTCTVRTGSILLLIGNGSREVCTQHDSMVGKAS